MNKDNVFRSSPFHMDEGDILHLLFLDETGTAMTVELFGSDDPDTPEVIADPTAVDFDGNYYTSVIIGTQEWLVENFRSEHYIDGTAIPVVEQSEYNDWFLPSKDELDAMYTELYLEGVGGFSTAAYWSSSEYDQFDAWTHQFSINNVAHPAKASNPTYRSRGIRSFTSTTSYSLRDVGPGGGWIFYKNGNDYLEANTVDNVASNWSNITGSLTGASGTAIGTGQANTTAIIGQVGHTDSAAKLCDDAVAGGWINDTDGAMCYYNNDETTYKPDYGALYNWYAVDNAHGFGITGWRVPSDADLSTLAIFLGGASIAGGKLKEVGTTHWNAPNTGATDEFGFKFYGGSNRNSEGLFNPINAMGYLWGSTSVNGTAKNRDCDDSSVLLGDFANDKNHGFSIRLMRDVT